MGALISVVLHLLDTILVVLVSLVTASVVLLLDHVKELETKTN
jgi:hypothetical protein